NKSRGAEIEFYFNNNKWDFLLSGSHIISKDYTQPEFITVNQSNFNVAQNPAFFTSQNPNGKRYTLFPRYIFSTGIGYNFDWNKLTVFLIQRWFSNFRDVVYENNTGSHYQKNYNRFDLTVSVSPTENFEGGFAVRNLTNRRNVVPGTYENSYGIYDEELNASVRMTVRM
ncbi:MAG TPA: TonB-dependent receptor, partial [Leptospiraceae bacterium]|nr:TonB-dependent receptor [Leptospiraceae bacterium]